MMSSFEVKKKDWLDIYRNRFQRFHTNEGDSQSQVRDNEENIPVLDFISLFIFY